MGKQLAIGVVAVALIPSRAAALDTNDLLSLVAMPLAVAAVSHVTDVPTADLMDVVALLNEAEVPPPQFIEVVRYVPVALVVDSPDGQPFVDYVRTRTRDGLRGPALVTQIQDRYIVYGVPEVDLRPRRTRVVEVNDEFIPRVVRTRIAEVSMSRHPLGGPPGQMKKHEPPILHRVMSEQPKQNLANAKPGVLVEWDEKTIPAPRALKAEKHESKSHGKGHARVAGQGKGHKGNGGKGHGKGK